MAGPEPRATSESPRVSEECEEVMVTHPVPRSQNFMVFFVFRRIREILGGR